MLLYYYARRNPKYLFFRQFFLWLYPVSGACTQASSPKIKLCYRTFNEKHFLDVCSTLRCKTGSKWHFSFTFSSNLAITITVTSREEGLGLFVGQSPGTSLEVLQEQPTERAQACYEAHNCLCFTWSNVYDLFWVSLQLLLLNEATVVLVNDGESLLDIIRGLGWQANLGEEGLVVKGVSSCGERVLCQNMIFIWSKYSNWNWC